MFHKHLTGSVDTILAQCLLLSSRIYVRAFGVVSLRKMKSFLSPFPIHITVMIKSILYKVALLSSPGKLFQCSQGAPFVVFEKKKSSVVGKTAQQNVEIRKKKHYYIWKQENKSQ